MRYKWLIATLCIAVTLAACEPSADERVEMTAAATTPLPAGDPEQGRELFEETVNTRCLGCHSLDGSEFRAGPTMLGISERAGERVPGLSAADYLRQSIVDPNAFIPEGYGSGIMPTFYAERLTEEELSDLVAFLLTQ